MGLVIKITSAMWTPLCNDIFLHSHVIRKPKNNTNIASFASNLVFCLKGMFFIFSQQEIIYIFHDVKGLNVPHSYVRDDHSKVEPLEWLILRVALSGQFGNCTFKGHFSQLPP